MAGLPTGLNSAANTASGVRSYQGANPGGNSPITASMGIQSAPQTGPIITDQNSQVGPRIYQYDVYDFMLNAYFGQGGFHDGTILVKSQIEPDKQYEERRANSYYKNYTRPIIDATYAPVFTKPVKREVQVNGVVDKNGTSAPQLAAFLKDVDGRKSDIGKFMKKTTRYSNMLGVAFVVVDNVAREDIPALVADAVAGRKFPYCVLRLPQQVERELLILDNFMEIEQIAFKEPNEGEQEIWKVWNKTSSYKITKDKDGKFVEVPDTRTEHNLGKTPVVPVFSGECEDGTLLPKPNFYDVARCNWALFNMCSSQNRLMRSQMFAIFCAPGMNAGFGTSPQRGFELKPDNSITGEKYPLPFYCAPPTGPYSEISQNINDLKSDLYQLAGQQGVTGVQQAVSGISKAYDWQGQEWILRQTALSAKSAEEKIVEMFGLYVTSEKFTYTADYTMDYQIVDQLAKGNQFSRFLSDVSTLSTPYNPVVAEGVREYAESTYDGIEDAEAAKIMKWITDNTTFEKEETPPEIGEEGAANDKIISFLQDKNRLPNGAIKKPAPAFKKKEAVTA
jgi:hypothetical protein